MNNGTDNRATSGQLGPKLPIPRQTAPVREMTREERAAIKKLVVSLCANYDRDYGCLPLDCDCVMLNTWWTGGGCKYFREAVLTTDPILEAALTGGAVETRTCALCGAVFPVDGKRAYCSNACADRAHKKQKRQSIQKKRGRV